MTTAEVLDVLAKYGEQIIAEMADHEVHLHAIAIIVRDDDNTWVAGTGDDAVVTLLAGLRLATKPPSASRERP